jgi:hypothetical protein
MFLLSESFSVSLCETLLFDNFFFLVTVVFAFTVVLILAACSNSCCLHLFSAEKMFVKNRSGHLTSKSKVIKES